MPERTGSDDAPLTASVGEQLVEKADADQDAAAARDAEEQRHARVERRKADERDVVLRHTGGERRLRPRRDLPIGARRRPATRRRSALWAGAAVLAVAAVGGVGRALLAAGVIVARERLARTTPW
jgi:hypothetical protein